MKVSSKHKQKTVLFADFSGGLNISVPPDMLKLNELQKADNFEFDTRSGILKTRAGLSLVHTEQNPIISLFYAYGLHKVFYKCGNKLHAYDFSSGQSEELGDLSGSRDPVFAEWDDDLLIASGGYLQVYDGSSLNTINNSPLCDFCFVKNGRVGLSLAGSDYLSFSGIGDYTNWNFAGTDADAQQIEVGYKEGGKLVGIRPFFDDLIIFKDNRRTYRLSGWYPDWEVNEVTRGHGAVNKDASAIIGSSIVFIDADGVVALTPTVEYGDFAFKQVGDKINNFFAANLDYNSSKIFHVPAKGQIWCKPNTSNIVYVLHYLTGAWTRFIFNDDINGALSCPYGSLVAINNKLYKFDDYRDDDDGTPINSVVVLPRKSGARELLLKYLSLIYQAYGQGNMVLTIGSYSRTIAVAQGDDIAYSDIDIISEDTDPLILTTHVRFNERTNRRLDYLEPKITCNGCRIGLIALTTEIADV